MEWSKGATNTLAYANTLRNNSINCALANNIKCTEHYILLASTPFDYTSLFDDEPGCEYVIGLCGVIGNLQSNSIIGS